MRLQTRTWDQNGPKFILDAYHVEKGLYQCNLLFSADIDCPVYQKIVFVKPEEEYQIGEFYIDTDTGKQISYEAFDPQVEYYKKPKIKWTVILNEEGMKNGSLEKQEWSSNKITGTFTMDEISSEQSITIPNFTFSDNCQNTDFIELKLEIDWDGYTFAKNTRAEESHSGIIMAHLTPEDSSFFWAPELYYNNDFVRMTDDINFYWNYTYHPDAQGQKIILSEEVENLVEILDETTGEIKEEVEIISRQLTYLELNDTSKNNITISLVALPVRPSYGAKLYAEIWAYGNNELESAHVKGVIGRINQPPNAVQINIGSSKISEDTSAFLKISTNNQADIIEGTADLSILKQTETGYELDERYKDLIIYSKDFEYNYTTQSGFGELVLTSEGDKYWLNDWIYTNNRIKIGNYKTMEFSLKSALGWWNGSGFFRLGLIKTPQKTDSTDAIVGISPYNDVGKTFFIDLSKLEDENDEGFYFGGTEGGTHSFQLGHVKLTGAPKTVVLPYQYNDPDNNKNDYLNLSQNLYCSINGSDKIKLEINEENFQNDELSLVIDKSYLQKFGIVEPGNYTFEAYVYDGLDYSLANSVTLTYLPNLSIKQQDIVISRIDDGYEDSVIASSIKYTFSLESNVSNIQTEILLYQNDTTFILPSENYVNVFNTKEKSIQIELLSSSLNNLPDFDIKQPFYIQPKIFYSFTPEISVFLNNTEEIQYPRKREVGQIFSEDKLTIAIPQATTDSIENYFTDKLEIKLILPELEKGYPLYDSLTAYIYNENGALLFNDLITKTKDEWYEELSMTNVSINQQIRLKLVYKDIIGQTTDFEAGTFTRAEKPVFSSANISISSDPLKPNSQTNVEITHSKAEASGSLKIYYEYSIYLPFYQEEKILNWEPIEENGIYKISLDQNAIKEIFYQDLNILTTATLNISAIDSFSQTTFIQKVFQVDFREKPKFLIENFDILHDYNIQSFDDLKDFESVPEPQAGEYNLEIRMFNPKEGIIFKIPKAIDLNSGLNNDLDVRRYIIEIARGQLPFNIEEVLESNQLVFSEWISINKEDLIDYGEDYYYYRYSASNYQKNEYFYFKIMAEDSTLLRSDPIFSKTFIIGCRTSAPDFNQGNVEIITKPIDNVGQTLTLSWENFIINDLGGSIISEGNWDVEYYKNYRNLEREINNYNKYIYLQVEISSDSDFTNPLVLKIREDYSEDFLNYLPYTENSKTFSHNFTYSELEAANLKNLEKFYLGFTLIVSSGPDALIQSRRQIISYYGTIPTVSHRAHQVGINNNIFQENDSLVISNYQTYRYVRLIGTDEVGKNSEIKIDLYTGEIIGGIFSGTLKAAGGSFNNIIIDGGSW